MVDFNIRPNTVLSSFIPSTAWNGTDGTMVDLVLGTCNEWRLSTNQHKMSDSIVRLTSKYQVL